MGVIPVNIVESFGFVIIICQGSNIVAFNVWVPHISAANSSLPTRTVFLTFNLASEGEYHE